MKQILTWCLRIVAVVLGAVGGRFAISAFEADWSSLRDAAAPIKHPGIAAAIVSLFFLGSAYVAIIASSPRRDYSAQVRLVATFFAIVGVIVIAFHYARFGA